MEPVQPVAHPSEADELGPGAAPIRLWKIVLPGVADVGHLVGLLDDNELARAHRFRFRPLYESFVVSHAALRLILAEEVGTDAERLRFSSRCRRCEGDHGKPEIAWPPSADLGFSLSHTTGIALVAVANGRLVGIDVQHTRDDLNFEGITSVWFAEDESRHLARLPAPAQAEHFFKLWTRREACAKALGLSVDHVLDASLMTQVSGRDHRANGPELTVRDLAIGPNFAAALCSTGTPWCMTWHDFPEDLQCSTARWRQSSAP